MKAIENISNILFQFSVIPWLLLQSVQKYFSVEPLVIQKPVNWFALRVYWTDFCVIRVSKILVFTISLNHLNNVLLALFFDFNLVIFNEWQGQCGRMNFLRNLFFYCKYTFQLVFFGQICLMHNDLWLKFN